MGADQNIDWNQQAASALAWWHEAGVDVLVGDAPPDWFDQGGAEASDHATPGDILPDTLEAFIAWRSGGDAPDAGWRSPAIAAEGDPAAALMVLVDCPERDDTDRLMQGPAGRLFDRMLAAIGLARGDVYLAAVCVRRPTTGRVPRETAETLGAAARRHVGLIAPARLLVLGDAASRAVLDTDGGPARGSSHRINHGDGTVTRAVASYHPRFLLEQPAAKAEAWRDLLMLTQDP